MKHLRALVRLTTAALATGLPLCAPAWGADPSWYNPDEVASRSARFGEVASNVGPSFEALQSQLSALGRDLGRLEAGVALLGARADDGLRAWDEGARRQVNAQYLSVQRHVDLLQDDYANVFQAAVDRALAGLPGGSSAVPCQSQGISAMMGRKPSCQGVDLSAKLAEKVDADPKLKSELDAISAVPWPSVTLAPSPQPVVSLTGTTRWIAVSAAVEALAPGWIASQREALEDQLAPLEEGLDEAQADAVGRATQVRAAWQTGLASAASPLFDAMTASLTRAAARDAGLADIGLCANPASLGGCPGEDVTERALSALLADKKVSREASRLTAVSSR